MYFKVSMRKNPATQQLQGYYRLVESYRKEYNRVCQRTLLNVGFLADITPEQLNKIQKLLSERAMSKISLFEEQDEWVLHFSEQLWEELITKKRIDLPEERLSKQQRLVDIETIKHKDVREVGALHSLQFVV
jgi:hypothetical protein